MTQRMRLLAPLMLVFLFVALVAGPAVAQTPTYVPAARYYGSATVLGQPAPGNVPILAQGIGGAFCGSGYVAPFGGYYSVDIQPSSPCAGAISFLVNGQLADQSSIIPNLLSGAVPFNLTVSSGCSAPYGPYGASGYGCTAYGPPPVTLANGPPPPPVTSAVSPYLTATSATYQPGWNLVAGPAGDQISGASSSLFTFQPGDTAYETLSAASPLQAGYGYWSQFPGITTVTVPASGTTPTYRSIPAGQIALIGNPFSRPATVSGASLVYAYDPVRGYQTTTLLQPGQGAWAVGTGGPVVIAST